MQASAIKNIFTPQMIDHETSNELRNCSLNCVFSGTNILHTVKKRQEWIHRRSNMSRRHSSCSSKFQVLSSFACWSSFSVKGLRKKMKPGQKKKLDYIVCQFVLMCLTSNMGHVLHDLENFSHAVSLKLVPAEPYRENIFWRFNKCKQLNWRVQKASLVAESGKRWKTFICVFSGC